MPLTVRRIPQIGRGFVEPRLDVGNAIPLQMMVIPGGTFMMGSPKDEPEREDSEDPQHPVTVPMFFMGRYPVTQAQYEAVMETNPAARYEAERFVAPDKPVVGVSWDDAIAFCQRLSELTERPYRLPSEAEWEYACRAGTTTPFSFGKTLTAEVANYCADYTYGNGPKGEFRNQTTPVNHFDIANAFALYEMHGSVCEWCADYWHDNYENSPTDGSAWIEGNYLSDRVLRGGSWNNLPRHCRSAYRDKNDSIIRNLNVGFRVVCASPRPLQ